MYVEISQDMINDFTALATQSVASHGVILYSLKATTTLGCMIGRELTGWNDESWENRGTAYKEADDEGHLSPPALDDGRREGVTRYLHQATHHYIYERIGAEHAAANVEAREH